MHSFLRPPSVLFVSSTTTDSPTNKLPSNKNKDRQQFARQASSRRRDESCAQVPAKTMPPKDEVPTAWTLALFELLCHLQRNQPYLDLE